MKITKQYLQKIIKEELSECMNDMAMAPMDQIPADMPVTVQAINGQEQGKYDYAGRMAKSNLFNIAKHAAEMHNLLSDNQQLEPWVQEKIAVATEMIETVAEYMEYEKTRGD